MSAERFDGHELIERLRGRHCKAMRNAGKSIGVVGVVDTQSWVRKGAKNADIIATIATTNRVDLESEVVLPDGGVFDYLLSNRKIFADHWYDIEHCVGGLARWGKAARGWKMEVGVLQRSPFPTPQAVQAIAEQIGIGASIGFEMLEGGLPTTEEKKLYPGAEFIVRKWNCLEVSLTCLPCNVDCQSGYGMLERSHADRARAMLDIGPDTEQARRLLSLTAPMLDLTAAA